MATPCRAVDTREKIIKSGIMKHRQTGIGLMRWRQRFVVFKITSSGRLQFVLYKEQPAIPDNEVKHVAIEEYGGLETNMKLENEVYTFAIITTNATDCFSTETLQELTDWTNLIQEYLGKEMVLNITVPSKQNILKSGRASLRIRNTGFTITSCDNPPRCQGTWQIIHIRKYGGTETFKFETGSKCPTGEHLYSIQTDDNQRVKSLFNDLSQHKPIFDDRVGRRMTLERSFNSKANNNTSHPSNRLSLQNTSTKDQTSHPLYQNALPVNGHLSTPNGRTARRHSATGGGEIFNPLSRAGAKTVPTASLGIDDSSSRLYQNVNRQTSHAGRVSPTKKVHQHIPEEYYNVTPPQVVQQKYRSSNSSPCSSPEDDNWFREQFLTKTTEEDYSSVTPGRSTSIHGDHLVFHEGVSQHDSASQGTVNGQHEGGTYQNLQFLQGNRSNSAIESIVSSPRPSDTTTQSHVPQPTVSALEQDWSPHNYTNVQLAVEAVHGKQHKKIPATTSSLVPSVDSTVQRKISTPTYLSGDREPLDVHFRQDAHNVLTETQSLSIPVKSPLRNSHSNFELNKEASGSLPDVAGKVYLPDYYNIFVPDLPANSPSTQHHSVTPIRKSRKPPNASVPDSAKQGVDMTDSPQAPDVVDNSNPRQPHLSSAITPAYSSVTNVDRHSKSPVISNYDSLTPLAATSSKDEDDQQHYDSLLPLKSSSSSPEPVISPTDSFSPVNRYDRKIQVTHHPHKYEYIDIDIHRSGESTSSEGVFSPSNSMEHPQAWMSPPPNDSNVTVLKKGDEETSSVTRSSLKETKTNSRRKQLPLQKAEEITAPANSQKPRAPRLTRIPLQSDHSITESPKVRAKPVPLPRFQQNRHSASSDDSNSSFEVVPAMTTVNKRDSTQECISPSSHRPAHQDDAPYRHKISSIHVEVVADQSRDVSTIAPPPLPPRKTIDDFTSPGHDKRADTSGPNSKISTENETPPVPPRPQEGTFKVPLPQAHFDFEKTATPPKPKVLYASEQPIKNYAALTFGEQDNNGYTEVGINQQVILPSSTPTEQVDCRVSYAAVNFRMTEALRDTREQVDDKKREFISANKRQ